MPSERKHSSQQMTQTAISGSFTDTLVTDLSWTITRDPAPVGYIRQMINFQHSLRLIVTLTLDQAALLVGQWTPEKYGSGSVDRPPSNSSSTAKHPTKDGWATDVDPHLLDPARPIQAALHYPMDKDVSAIIQPATRAYSKVARTTSSAVPVIPSYGFIAWQLALIYRQIYVTGRDRVGWWGPAFDELLLDGILIHEHNVITVILTEQAG